MNYSKFQSMLITCILTASLSAGFVSGKDPAKEALVLLWNEPPSLIQRGETHFKFSLRNPTSGSVILAKWVPQRGEPRDNIPNVIVFAAPVGDEAKRYALSPSFPVGQIPTTSSTVAIGEVRSIDAVVRCDLEDGRYLMWAQLRSGQPVSSSKIEVTVKGGVPAEYRQK